MKDTRQLMHDATQAWIEEDVPNRHVFCIVGDLKEGVTSCGMSGDNEAIVSAIVNEMITDDEVFNIIVTSMEICMAMRAEEIKESAKEITKFKIYS